MIEAAVPPVALVVEPHAFFSGYVRDVLARTGHAKVASSRFGSRLTLRRLAPDTVVIGSSACGARPLGVIRRVRAERPDARIVVIAERNDPAWHAVARAIGADDVLGPDAGEPELIAALSYGQFRQENGATCRTTYTNVSLFERSSSDSYPG